MSQPMLIALRDGVVEDEGRLHEIEAGKSRIAPEVLARNPAYAEFFEDDFSAPGTDATRSEVRTMLPDGRTIAA